MSWSGERSHEVAKLLRWWTKCVIQATSPWISSEDVDRGSLWFTEIHGNLSDTAVGIVCLTDENKERPWILFESGALAKGLANSRVCTFLIDLEPKDIKDPLAQFNHTMPTEDGMKKLARTLNGALGTAQLPLDVLSDVCDTYWPMFKQRLDRLLVDFPPAKPKVARSDNEVLEEILDSVRGMDKRLRQVESREQYPGWTDAVDNSVDSVLSRNSIADAAMRDKLSSIWNTNISAEMYAELMSKDAAHLEDYMNKVRSREEKLARDQKALDAKRRKSNG
jgi:hypothetical protein